MKLLNVIKRALACLCRPIKVNGAFFVFMYVLGVLCAWVTLRHTKGAELYGNLYLELFLDVYLVCVVLTLLPRRVRLWVRRLLYVLLYGVAIVDVYCFVKFDSTLTPTMLLLVGETNSREAGEFIRSYLSADVLFSKVGWVLLLVVLHMVYALRHRLVKKLKKRHSTLADAARPPFTLPQVAQAEPLLGLLVAVLLVVSSITSAHNKLESWKMMTAENIGTVEHLLTEHDHAVFYTPVSRLAFSLYANSLTAQQLDVCRAVAGKAVVDSCSFTSPNIVLIIGESYGKQHSQQYGYFMPTTPRQIAREKTGMLVRFNDVVSPWNLTSFVFKLMFSTYTVGDKGEWCDYPLFPVLFRKAGYHVSFLTNQFLPKAKEAVYDFSGGFFLNDPELSKAQFDTRNTQLHQFDEDLIHDFRAMRDSSLLPFSDKPTRFKRKRLDRNLIIFHLIGQHVNYRQRSPKDRKKFKADDYDAARPELNGRQKRILADYDNAILYNDSVVDQICKQFENENAVVIYVPDHGEECYEGDRGFICRNHSSEIDYDLAHYEFRVPFWIYCSHSYAVSHPEIYKAMVEAKDRRYMTDALPHLLLYLAGIHTPSYQPRYNILSPEYDEKRPRILKNVTDYDMLKRPEPGLNAAESEPFGRNRHV